MVLWSFFWAGAFISLLLLGLLCADALGRAWAAWRRRRHAQGGVYGVVIDRTGRILGTYVDPLQSPRIASRVHEPGSVWSGSDPSDPTAWAWEGQGETEEEALYAANRLRYLYLSLLPELRGQDRPASDEESAGRPPWA